MSTKKLLAIVSMAFFVSVNQGASLWASEGDSLDNLMNEGKVTLDFRYRYEFVDQEGIDNNANASTLRTRLGFRSGDWQGWGFNIEVNDVRHVLSNNFNAGGGTTPDRGGVYPVVADPKGTRLNQGYISYSGIEDWAFRAGRQRINLDNERFIGSVGWRQTEQVFDSGTVAWSKDKADVALTYVQWVRRIFGEESPIGKHRQDGTVLLRGAYDLSFGKLVGYYYRIENRDAPGFSTNTFGARLAGKPAINDNWALRYEVEYANQKDLGNNPAGFSADYVHLVAAAAVGIFDFGVGYELLSGKEGTLFNEAFRTPLATLHRWNGWADQFLSTPAAGLVDTHVTFKATPGRFLIDARYHNFDADSGSDKYGTELDLRVGYKFTDRFRGDLYLADFKGRDNPGVVNDFVDVTKFWVQVYFKL